VAEMRNWKGTRYSKKEKRGRSYGEKLIIGKIDASLKSKPCPRHHILLREEEKMLFL
jgi:hypothetical protein